MGAALSHAEADSSSSDHRANVQVPPVEQDRPRSRRQVFEDTLAVKTRTYAPHEVSLRDEEPVASTSRAPWFGRQQQQQTSRSSSSGKSKHAGPAYSTLEEFRQQDRDRKSRLRNLYNTLRQEWSLPHDHEHFTVHPHEQNNASTTAVLDGGSAARQPTTVEKRIETINKEYLTELYHSLCPGDEARKGKGPSYDRFSSFVEAKEQALWELFCNIDKDQDMQLTPDELQGALSRADIKISPEKLKLMIGTMDKSGTGRVTFEEWRDFLLLLPRPASMSNVWTYWTSHTTPRLATSIATQDLDVILAEKPAPPASSSSFGASTASSRPSTSPSARKGDDSDNSAEVEGKEEEDSKPIFEGSGAYLLAGGLAGAVSRTATAPFDRLKVYLINAVDRSNAKIPSVGNPAAHPVKAARSVAAVSGHGLGVLGSAIRDLRNQGGIKAFFVGNGLNVLKIFPESAVKFWSYEYSKRWFAKNVDRCSVADISGSSRFVAGGIGGVVSQLLIYPLETWKTRVMSSTSSDPKALRGNALYLATAKDMLKTGGVRAYYSGLAMGLIGVFPYSAIDMSLFAAFKKAYTQYTGDEEPGALGSLTFGALSGGLGATSVYPLNLLRTRMQTQGTPSHPQKYTGWRDVAIKCYRNEGIRGFYKGLSPTLLKVSPSMGISWVVYEYSTSIFFPRHDDSSPQETTDK